MGNDYPSRIPRLRYALGLSAESSARALGSRRDQTTHSQRNCWRNPRLIAFPARNPIILHPTAHEPHFAYRGMNFLEDSGSTHPWNPGTLSGCGAESLRATTLSRSF